MLGTAVLLGVVVAGLPVLRQHRAALPLIVVAAVAVLVPAGLATGPGLAVLRAVVDAAPGLGVVRDGQKWVALAMPGYALAGAGAVQTLRRWVHPAVTALICCTALMFVLPDLAWGGWGKVEPVHYPSGWRAVAAAINADAGPVAVLPAGTMRRFAWSGPQPVLDPLPRWLRADVLTTGDLTISGVTVPGEGRRARAVEQLLLSGADGDALARAGVRWLVVEGRTPGELGAAARVFEQLHTVYRDGDLALYSVGGDAPGASTGRRSAVLIAHLAWLAMLGVGAVGMAAAGWRRPAGSANREA